MPGSFNPFYNSTCANCNIGSWSSAGAVSCIVCAPGTYTITDPTGSPIDGWATSDLFACKPCQKNTWSSARGVPCTPCPVNTYSDGIGETTKATCLPCGANQCSAAGDVCKSAPPGKYANLTKCESNFYALSNPLPFRALTARALTVRIDTDSIFPLCDPGTFSDERGLAACKLCPSGTFNPTTGAFSMSSCLSCRAVSPALVADVLGAPDASVCVSCAGGEGMRFSNGTHCLPCPVGMWCDGTPDFVLCMGSGSHCLGASGCAPGYEGYRCQGCARGYYPDMERSTGGPSLLSGYVDANIECKPCPGVEWYNVVGVFFGIAVAAAALGFFLRWGRSRGAPPAVSAALYVGAHTCTRLCKRLDHVQQKHRPVFGMFGMHVKRLVVLHNAAGLSLPTATRQWLSWSALFSFASADALRPVCILPWNQDTTWKALVCFGFITTALLVAVDYTRIRSMEEKNVTDSPSNPYTPKLAEGRGGRFAGFLRRLLTNNDSDFETALWSASFANWMAGVFFSYALRAITCRTSAVDGKFFNAYDPTVGECLASSHRGIYLSSIVFVLCYLAYLSFYFVVPFCAVFSDACSKRCVRHRAGHENIRSHRFILMWRLVRNALPTLSSFVILFPDSPSTCAGVMLAFFAVELLAWLPSRCYHSVLGRYGQLPYGPYLATSFLTLLCTAIYAADPRFNTSPSVGHWGTALIVLNFFVFPLFFLASLGCLTLRDHDPDTTLVYTSSVEPKQLCAYSVADKLPEKHPGCGGCTLANAWLCLRPLCQDAKRYAKQENRTRSETCATQPFMHHRHFAINPDHRECCWHCGVRTERKLKLRVLRPGFNGDKMFLCADNAGTIGTLKELIDELDNLVVANNDRLVERGKAGMVNELAALLESEVVAPAVAAFMAKNVSPLPRATPTRPNTQSPF